jgi:capsular exopolysaccharide synthesis family protein
MYKEIPANAMVPQSQIPQELQPHNYNYNYSYSGDSEPRNRLYDYWNIIVKRKRLILGCFLGSMLIVGLITFLKTPVYKSSVILQIMPDSPAAILGGRDYLSTSANSQDEQPRFFESQYLILRSRALAKRIINDLNLKDHQEFKSLQKSEVEKPGDLETELTDAFLKHLEVKALKKSDMFEVAFQSTDKHLAQQVPNAIYEEFVTLSMHTRQQSYALIKKWLGTQLEQLASKLENSEKSLYEHGKEKDFLSLEDKNENVIVQKYIDLSNLLTKAQSERAVKEAQYQQIKGQPLDTPAVVNNPLVQRLREETVAQEARVSSLNKIYGSNYPQFQAERAKLGEMRARLNAEVNRVRGSIEADYQAALKTEKLLRDELQDQKGKVEDLQQALVQHHILKRDMQTNQQLYEALLARMKEASVASTMVPANVAVISPAELPLKPDSPKKSLNMALAAAIGLIGGLGMAFIMEHLDHTIKSTGDLEKVCQIPPIGVIPFLSKNNNGSGPKELMTFNHPSSILGEAINHVGTSIMLSSAENPPATIMITSPNPNEGKTTISLNVAASLAMTGRRVVLIDADLRKPGLHEILQQPLEPGLGNFLAGTASMAELLRNTSVPNLSFIAAGVTRGNPFALLTSQAFQEFIEALKNDFQHVIFDTPPIIDFADARTISSLMDGVLVIFKHHYTSQRSARLAVQLLTQLNVKRIGGILNMAKTPKANCSYGDYYHGAC